MISQQDAITEGMEVVKLATAHFYVTNSESYRIYGYDQADLEQYLHEAILVRRYLKSVRETPEFYKSIKNYRSSLYVSCRKALLAHYRQITAKKRRDLFRSGAIVRINLENQETDQLPQFEGLAMFKQTEQTDVVIKRISDQLLDSGDQLAALMFILVSHDETSKTGLGKKFPFLKAQEIEESFRSIRRVITSQQ